MEGWASQKYFLCNVLATTQVLHGFQKIMNCINLVMKKCLPATEPRDLEIIHVKGKDVFLFQARRWVTWCCSIAISSWLPSQKTDVYLITLSNGCDFSSHSYPLGKLLLWFSSAIWLHFLTLWFQRGRGSGEFPGWPICLCYGQMNTTWSSKSLGLGVG